MLRPIVRDVGEFERLLLPVKMNKPGVSLFHKLRESAARRKQRQRAQSFGCRARFVVRTRLTEFAQRFDVVEQYLPVTLMQNVLENLPTDFGRYNRRVGQRI